MSTRVAERSFQHIGSIPSKSFRERHQYVSYDVPGIIIHKTLHKYPPLEANDTCRRYNPGQNRLYPPPWQGNDPLDGQPALAHVDTRTTQADNVTDIVVATLIKPQDDEIAQYAPTFGAGVIRGSKSNVLTRFERAVEEYDPDIVLRITGDYPLIDTTTIDRVVASVEEVKPTTRATYLNERSLAGLA